ncbi:MAG: hypothetical protein HYZ84_07515 [Candidatus Omnitrophica bacterium]|nr:hypothetical protein [Candidatus Omnitrophota bacterium]
MWKLYRSTILKYPKIPLPEERRLIALAQKGSKKSAEEIVLRHIGFLIFRLHKKAFPNFLKRFGEDLVSEATLILYQKIKTYDLDYCDKHGNPKPVKFVSYIWKRIDGFILDFLKKEIQREREEQSQVRAGDSKIFDGTSETVSWCRPFGLYPAYASSSRARISAGQGHFTVGSRCLTFRCRFLDFPSSLKHPV